MLLKRFGVAVAILVVLSCIGSLRVDVHNTGVSISLSFVDRTGPMAPTTSAAESLDKRTKETSPALPDRSPLEATPRIGPSAEIGPLEALENQFVDDTQSRRRKPEIHPAAKRLARGGDQRNAKPERDRPTRRPTVDHIPGRTFVRQGRNISSDVYRKYLPPGQKLFCPSYDDDPQMRHFGPPQEIKPRGFRTKERRVRVIRNIIMGKYTFRIDGCPAPVTLKRVSHPPMIRKSGYRYGCLELRVTHTISDEPNSHSIIVDRAPTPKIIRRDVENKVIPKEDLYSTVPNNVPQSRRCLEACLKLPCCVGFQLFNSDNETFRLCHLLECDYGFPDSIAPDNEREVALITHRREFRPSLVVSDARITIVQGPNNTIYLDNTSSWSDTLQVRLHAGFGQLLNQEGLVACCLRQTGRSGTAINNAWSGRVAQGVSGDVFGDLSAYIGQNITLHCETTPRGEKTVGKALLVDLEVPVMTLAQNITSDSTLQWDAKREHSVFRGGRCASYLKESECCLQGIAARVVRLGDAKTKVGSPLLVGAYVNVSLESPADPAASPGCVEVVDGWYSYLDERSEAEFPNLVLRHWCTQQELDDPRRVMKIVLNTEAPISTPPALHVPLRVLAGCRGASTVPPPAKPKDKAAENEPPILASILVHQEMPVLISQLENIRFFIPGAIAVLHFSGDWIVTDEEWHNLTRANDTILQGSVFVNRFTMPLSGVIVANGHAKNILYMLREMPHIDFSHVITLASNEMFVRHGAAEYVRQYDMSSFDPPTRQSGQQFLHAHGDRYLESIPVEANDAPRFDHALWPFGPFDVFRSDFPLAEAMRRRNLTKYRTNQFYMEGAFFRKSIAQEFAVMMAEEFSPDSFCLVHWLAPSEVMPPVLMQNHCQRYKCGEHISMMLWRNDKYFATLEDIRRIRCSPFAVPFGVKRVPRKMDDDVRVFLMSLTQNEAPHTTATALRELDDVYCRNISVWNSAAGV